MERHEPQELIETPRMRGERIRPEHEDALLALLGDPQVGYTLGGAQTRDGVRGVIELHTIEWDRDGFSYFIFFDRETGEMVGRGGPRRVQVAGGEEVEIGWAVTPDRWGQGYATEIGAAAIALAFARGAPSVVAYTLPDNLASRRVMDKLGFSYEREFVHYELPHVLYRLQGPGDSTS